MKALEVAGKGGPRVLVVEDSGDDALLLRVAAAEACPEVSLVVQGSGEAGVAKGCPEAKCGV